MRQGLASIDSDSETITELDQASMSSNAKKAPTYCPEGENREEWERHLRQVTGLDNIDAPAKLKVYLLKPEGMWVHHSLLFYTGRKLFVIHLLKFSDKQGKEYATLSINPFDPKEPKYQQLHASELGTITKSIQGLFKTAQETLKTMGPYNAVLNNCQDYCSKLAESLGCGSYWTDREKVTITLTVAGIGFGLGLVAAALSADSEKESEK